MDKIEIATKINDVVKALESAQDFKGPYVLKINGMDTIVNREQFLDFYIDVTIQDLWGIQETLEENMVSTHE